MIWNNTIDMARFSRLTANQVVVVGRVTAESLRQSFFEKGRTVVVMAGGYKDPAEIAKKYADRDIWVIGGEQVYKQFLPIADRLEITLVKQPLEGDAFFPKIGEEWQEVAKDDRGGYAFISYARSKPSTP